MKYVFFKKMCKNFINSLSLYKIIFHIFPHIADVCIYSVRGRKVEKNVLFLLQANYTALIGQNDTVSSGTVQLNGSQAAQLPTVPESTAVPNADSTSHPHYHPYPHPYFHQHHSRTKSARGLKSTQDSKHHVHVSSHR